MSTRVLGTVQTCSRCHRRRKVNAHWQDSGVVMCRECSREPDVALAASYRQSGWAGKVWWSGHTDD
jgi:late competence protein required for DNA uptake (superfamily II DNA/RNA helicase)